MKQCPMCEKGELKPTKEKHVLFGVDLGTYPAEKCTVCGEIFTDIKDLQKIGAVAKAKGVWGLGKATKITRSGNSLAVRIPMVIAKHLGLKEGKEAFIHPEKDRLIIETG